MNENKRIADQLRRAYEKDAWHGPSLTELLLDVTPKQASARPIARAHTIWELVLHVTTWERYVTKRLQAKPGEEHEPTPDENFPAVTDASEAAWKKTRDDLKHADERLRAAILEISDARLEDNVPGKPYSVYGMLHGVVQHNLYHAGQIAVLKKAG